MLEGLEGLLNHAKTHIEEHLENREVEKTLPAKPEWKKMHKELVKMAEQKSKLQAELVSKRNLMWALIEKDIGIYDRNLGWSENHKEILVYEDND